MNKFVFDFEKPIVELENKIQEMHELAADGKVDISTEIDQLEEKAEKLRDEVYSNLNRWQRVQIARHPRRPYTLDYIERITDSFQELHGDRLYRDDRAIVAGLATIDSVPLAIIGHQKGRGTKLNIFRNFGMPHPEGYRKALRVMKLAEKFGLPIVTLIDTPGAWPGLGAEERGQAEAIARNLFEMSTLRVPIISVVIGEGGSGGALALGVTDRIIMLEYSVYSVITPEGCASILYRDANLANKAAEALRITPTDLQELEIIDEIIDEPVGGAHHDWDFVASNVKKSIICKLEELKKIDIDELIEERIDKYGNIGFFDED
ncbi:MAG: acetyl-CoA carboxylase carboxyltransferase subunit alpha [Candidatus Electryonea clarkiae]|nr:acetyl-CoA carboxylase carboxyltransferase subunit alpha [Candidatus Electryonea clarkiae]